MCQLRVMASKEPEIREFQNAFPNRWHAYTRSPFECWISALLGDSRGVARISIAATQKALASICSVATRAGCVLCSEKKRRSATDFRFLDHEVSVGEGVLNLHRKCFTLTNLD